MATSTPLPDPNLTPAMTAPPGLVSNLIDPPSQGYVTIVVLTVSLVLTTVLVAERMYVRQYITRSLWWDDCKSLHLGRCALWRSAVLANGPS
jgi:hypothetical protein